MNLLLNNPKFEISSFYFHSINSYNIHLTVYIDPLIYNIKTHTKYFYPAISYPHYFNYLANHLFIILSDFKLEIHTTIQKN